MSISFFDRKLKVWQWIMVMLLIAIAVMLLLYTCKHDKPASNPKEKPSFTIKKEIVTDTAALRIVAKNVADSIGHIINKIDYQLTKTTNQLLYAQDNVLLLQQQNDSLLSQLSESDLTNEITNKSDQIRRQIKINDSICNETISLLTEKSKEKDALLSERDKLFKNINDKLSLCLQNLDTTAVDDKVTPHNKLAIGFVGNFYPVAGLGAGLTFVHKKGLVINTDVLRMNNAWYVQGGVKWVISLKRK